MVRPRLVKLSYCKFLGADERYVKLKPFTTLKMFFNNYCYTKNKFKNTETYKYFQGEGAIRPLGKWGNVTLIHLINCKSQIFADEILQCLNDKYQIAYQNITRGFLTCYSSSKYSCIVKYNSKTLPKKCPYLELLYFTFSSILTEYEKILRISLYSVQMRKIADQNNSKYGHFLRRESLKLSFFISDVKKSTLYW